MVWSGVVWRTILRGFVVHVLCSCDRAVCGLQRVISPLVSTGRCEMSIVCDDFVGRFRTSFEFGCLHPYHNYFFIFKHFFFWGGRGWLVFFSLNAISLFFATEKNERPGPSCCTAS